MPRSVSEGFQVLIERIQPLNSEHDKGAKHKATVSSCLEKNFKCYNLFETGSFGNGTGVRHHSDTDYFAVCPTANLSNNSGYVLIRFRDALRYTFHSTEGIRVNTPAVQVPFGQYASETLEVTPAIFNGLINTPLGQKAYYSIPNFDDGWMQSSPDAHNAYVTKQDNRLLKRVKPLIQLVKAWKYYNEAPILSFYLELRIAKYAETETSISYDIDFRNVLRFLANNNLANMQDPMGISGYVAPCKTSPQKETSLTKIRSDLDRAEKAVSLRDSNPDEAFRLWNLIFNYNFPAR